MCEKLTRSSSVHLPPSPLATYYVSVSVPFCLGPRPRYVYHAFSIPVATYPLFCTPAFILPKFTQTSRSNSWT